MTIKNKVFYYVGVFVIKNCKVSLSCVKYVHKTLPTTPINTNAKTKQEQQLRFIEDITQHQELC